MRFEKVTKERYFKDCGYTDKFGDDLLIGCEEEYNDIELPKRATKGSAGYDFFAPFDINLQQGETMIVPTGIRWVATVDNSDILYDIALYLYPRSGLGFKYLMGLANTVGIIDSDYFQSDNEGHIMAKIVNNGNKPIDIKKGQGFVQGIISVYYKVDDDETVEQRNGGFGSSDK